MTQPANDQTLRHVPNQIFKNTFYCLIKVMGNDPIWYSGRDQILIGEPRWWKRFDVLKKSLL